MLSFRGWFIWFFRYKYLYFEIGAFLFLLRLFKFLLRHIHLNSYIFLLSSFFIFPRFDWLLSFSFSRRIWLKNRGLIVVIFFKLMDDIRRTNFCYIRTFCRFCLFLLDSSLNTRFFTFFLRSSLICLRISYLLSSFYFLSLSFASLSVLSFLSIF